MTENENKQFLSILCEMSVTNVKNIFFLLHITAEFGLMHIQYISKLSLDNIFVNSLVLPLIFQKSIYSNSLYFLFFPFK